jgi:hypothetical protein
MCIFANVYAGPSGLAGVSDGVSPPLSNPALLEIEFGMGNCPGLLSPVCPFPRTDHTHRAVSLSPSEGSGLGEGSVFSHPGWFKVPLPVQNKRRLSMLHALDLLSTPPRPTSLSPTALRRDPSLFYPGPLQRNQFTLGL